MSPVRGHGHYKRPYRLTWTDKDGKKRHAEFHWKGPARATELQLRRFGMENVVLKYDVRNDT